MNEKLGLSPGIFTKKRAFQRDKVRAKRRLKLQSPTFKRHRRELREKRKVSTISSEVREGPTYGADAANKDADISEIPPPPNPPSLFQGSEEFEQVYFDLETTGFGKYKTQLYLILTMVFLYLNS